jgi:hypothetical protein
MATAGIESTTFTLSLDEEERAQLLSLLERVRGDTHVEARRTENPDFQKLVHHQEAVLRRVIDKLRRS